MNLKKAWRFFTGTALKAEMVRFGVVGVLGSFWMAVIMWLFLDVLQIRIEFWVVKAWMVPFAVGTAFAYFHNFFLNKLLGGLTKIERRKVNR